MQQKESITKMGITPFTIKNYCPDDLENYARLLEEIEAHDRSGRYSSKQSLVEDLGHPRFLPETNLFLARHDGDLIGYFSVFQEPEIGRALLDSAVHPSRRRKGIGSKLFDTAVRQAGRAGLDVAQICISEHNNAAQKMMSGQEMKYIRDHIGFQLDLTGVKIPAVTSGDYIIRHLGPGEEHQLTALQNLAFSGAWGFNPNTTEEIVYRVHLSSCTPEDILMAYQGEQPIGYCWTRIQVNEISTPSTRTGEIHMIGVDPDYRQKGLGRNILLSGLHHLKGKGLAKVELTADGEDPVPGGLYESVGFKKTSRMRWYEKKLN